MEERRILEVSVLARGLPKLDMFSRTNPFVVVFKSEGIISFRCVLVYPFSRFHLKLKSSGRRRRGLEGGW